MTNQHDPTHKNAFVQLHLCLFRSAVCPGLWAYMRVWIWIPSTLYVLVIRHIESMKNQSEKQTDMQPVICTRGRPPFHCLWLHVRLSKACRNIIGNSIYFILLGKKKVKSINSISSEEPIPLKSEKQET